MEFNLRKEGYNDYKEWGKIESFCMFYICNKKVLVVYIIVCRYVFWQWWGKLKHIPVAKVTKPNPIMPISRIAAGEPLLRQMHTKRSSVCFFIGHLFITTE